jgi:Carboxypeptidase regulatory-like domain
MWAVSNPVGGGLAMLLSLKSLVVVAAVVVVLGATAWAQEPTAELNFLVIKDYNGKPVRNAAVVLHPVNPHGKQGRGGFELKTDSDGKTHFEGVPYGKLRVQVLAPGFQTFGEDYDIDAASKDITVKLKRPQKQYSIYDDLQGTPKKETPGDKKDPEKPQ